MLSGWVGVVLTLFRAWYCEAEGRDPAAEVDLRFCYEEEGRGGEGRGEEGREGSWGGEEVRERR